MPRIESVATLSLGRRAFLRAAGTSMAAAVLPSLPLPAVAQGSGSVGVLMRALPGGIGRIPAIGLGTFMTFDLLPGADRDRHFEVMRRFWAAGGRLVDTSPLYGTAEVNVGDFAARMGVNGSMLVSNKIWSTGEFLADASHAERSLQQSLQRLWRGNIDLMHCHNLVNVDVVLPLLQAWKREKRIRLAGLSHHDPAYFDPMADWIEKGGVDVVQLRYSMLTTQAEARVLPAAVAADTAVIVHMPFEKARLFELVKGRALPNFAAEIGAATWAQFFLKWVLGHPAVTCVLAGTSDPEHMDDNMAALRGPLPDARMRARMLAHVRALPGYDRLESAPWYPDKTYPGVIGRAQAELRARR
jgi:aryl-alcohol dehydrogenase-like predicted oxidoreductase